MPICAVLIFTILLDISNGESKSSPAVQLPSPGSVLPLNTLNLSAKNLISDIGSDVLPSEAIIDIPATAPPAFKFILYLDSTYPSTVDKALACVLILEV